MSIAQVVDKMLEPVKRRILMLFARAIVKQINDAGGIQLLKIEALEDEFRDVERLQNYGLTSHPPKESDALVAFLGGIRSHGFAIAVEHRDSRMVGLAEGEVALYTDEESYVALRRNKEMHVRADKWKMEGETEELMDLLAQVTTQLIDLTDTLNTDTTNTLFGPMKLNAFAHYGEIKTELQTLKTKLQSITA